MIEKENIFFRKMILVTEYAALINISLVHVSCLRGIGKQCSPRSDYRMWGLMKVSTIRMSTSLDPDLARHFVWPDLGSTMFAKIISRKH